MDFLARLPDERALIVAMDHARTSGVVAGLEDPGAVIEMAIEGGADAVMTTFGVVKRFRAQLIGRIPVFLRLDGGPSEYREDWLHYTEWDLLHTVEDALLLGADGVAVMAFIGCDAELSTLRIVASVAGECLRSRNPLMVEALPCPCPRIPDAKDVKAMADAARIGFEHGADLIKTYYTGTQAAFSQVVQGCPVPVLIAGGPRMETDRDVLTVVDQAMAAGARGIVFGRNIWQHARPRQMLRALRAVVHERVSVDEAMALLE